MRPRLGCREGIASEKQENNCLRDYKSKGRHLLIKHMMLWTEDSVLSIRGRVEGWPA